jgi:hypothetical protein
LAGDSGACRFHQGASQRMYFSGIRAVKPSHGARGGAVYILDRANGARSVWAMANTRQTLAASAEKTSLLHSCARTILTATA